MRAGSNTTRGYAPRTKSGTVPTSSPLDPARRDTNRRKSFDNSALGGQPLPCRTMSEEPSEDKQGGAALRCSRSVVGAGALHRPGRLRHGLGPSRPAPRSAPPEAPGTGARRGDGRRRYSSDRSEGREESRRGRRRGGAAARCCRPAARRSSNRIGACCRRLRGLPRNVLFMEASRAPCSALRQPPSRSRSRRLLAGQRCAAASTAAGASASSARPDQAHADPKTVSRALPAPRRAPAQRTSAPPVWRAAPSRPVRGDDGGDVESTSSSLLGLADHRPCTTSLSPAPTAMDPCHVADFGGGGGSVAAGDVHFRAIDIALGARGHQAAAAAGASSMAVEDEPRHQQEVQPTSARRTRRPCGPPLPPSRSCRRAGRQRGGSKIGTRIQATCRQRMAREPARRVDLDLGGRTGSRSRSSTSRRRW